MAFQNWLLLTYKVPPQPSRTRVALWRRLKALGAVYLQDGVCLLPKTDEHARQLKILVNDLIESGGEAVIMETAALDRSQEDYVIARFKADRDEEYREFLDKCSSFEQEIANETAAAHYTYAELEENDVDLRKLQSWLEMIRKLDFYEGTLAQEAVRRLKGCEELFDQYAQQVFNAQDENRQQELHRIDTIKKIAGGLSDQINTPLMTLSLSIHALRDDLKSGSDDTENMLKYIEEMEIAYSKILGFMEVVREKYWKAKEVSDGCGGTIYEIQKKP